MKKIIVAVALVLTTGVLASKTKVNHASVTQPAITKATFSADNKELASGD